MRVLLLDACVVIDLVTAAPEVIPLAGAHLGRVCVTSVVLAEVRTVEPTTAAELGIDVVDTDWTLVDEALRRGSRGGLSFQDWTCVLMASARGWTCVSNDRALRRACESEGVSVWWGLELVARLAETAALTPIDAGRIGDRIAASNSRIGPQVIAGFRSRLGLQA